MITIAQISALLEKLILPTIQDQLFNKTVLLKYFKKNMDGVTFNNDKIYITALTSGHSWVGFTGATGAITTGKSTDQQMVVSAKYGYGSHIIWDSAIQTAKGKPGSLVSLVKKLGRDLEMEFKKSLNRQLFWDGKGTLTLIDGAGVATATQTVDSTRFLRVGQVLEVGTTAEIEAGTADEVTVATINSATSVTFTGAVTTADNDVIITKGAYNTTDSQYEELDGLSNLVSNETVDAGSSFQGIVRATNDWTNSYVDATSAVLTEAQIIDLVADVAEFGDPDLIMTTVTLQNKYSSLLASQKRFMNTVDLKGWFKGLEVSVGSQPIPMVSDYDCPSGNLFVLDTSSFSLAELNKLQYLADGSGSIMTNVYDTNGARIPAFQTTMKFYGNLVCTNPRANGKLTNKTAS